MIVFYLFSDTPYFRIIDKDGQIKLFRKSTLCWLLNKKSRVSTDRIYRYVSNKKVPSTVQTVTNKLFFKETTICIGDHIICKEGESLILGEVINFQMLNEKTLKNRRIVSTSINLLTKKNEGLTANWHLITGVKLIPMHMKDYIAKLNYFCHVDPVLVDPENLVLIKTVPEQFDDELGVESF